MEEKYAKVIAAIPFWKPSREVRQFGVSAIQNIVRCGLKEAVEIKERLEYEGALPTKKYN